MEGWCAADSLTAEEMAATGNTGSPFGVRRRPGKSAGQVGPACSHARNQIVCRTAEGSASVDYESNGGGVVLLELKRPSLWKAQYRVTVPMEEK